MLTLFVSKLTQFAVLSHAINNFMALISQGFMQSDTYFAICDDTYHVIYCHPYLWLTGLIISEKRRSSKVRHLEDAGRVW